MAALKNAAIFYLKKLHEYVIPKKARLRNLQLPSKKLVCIGFLPLVEMTSTLASSTSSDWSKPSTFSAHAFPFSLVFRIKTAR